MVSNNGTFRILELKEKEKILNSVENKLKRRSVVDKYLSSLGSYFLSLSTFRFSCCR